MSDVVEVLFACDSSESNQISCTAWDFRTATNLMNYRGGGTSQQHSFSLIDSSFILTANSTKPLLHVWPINGQEVLSSVRYVVPGRVTSMAMSPDSIFLVAGIQEVIYIWHLNNGRMLTSISKHYQAINCIKFTDDSSHFVTAGKDGVVMVWNLTKLIGGFENNEDPVYTFNDHGLPVTDVFVGTGGMRANMFTVSLDRTCKMYDLVGGELLLNVVFAESLHSVIANALEISVYVGTNEGNIFEFNINALPRTKECNAVEEITNCFVGHKPKTIVNCLELSADGETLISGGEDAQICIWHIASRQLLKIMPQKGPITNIFLKLTSPVIFEPDHKQPQLFANNLKRMIDPPEAITDETIEILVTDQWDQLDSEESDGDFSATSSDEEETSSSSKPSAGQAEEIAKLRAEIENLKTVNKQLFEVATKQIIKKNKTKHN